MKKLFRTTTGRDGYAWPVLLLFLTVLVPSAGIVWMMRAAMVNERFAVRQRLTDAYQVQLESAKRQLMRQWQDQLAELDVIVRDHLPEQAFARCATRGTVDSVLVLDESGRTTYPLPVVAVELQNALSDSQWAHAERLEFVDNRPSSAAEIYAAIAQDGEDPQRIARAEQALARCLLRVGNHDEAVGALNRLRQHATSTDAHGRLLVIDAELRLLELLAPDATDRANLVTSLQSRLNTYDGPLPTANQRRFAMRQLNELVPHLPPFATLEAEDMAADFLAHRGAAAVGPQLHPTAVEGIWSSLSPGGRAIALLRTATVERQVNHLLADQLLPSGVIVRIRQPARSGDLQGHLLATSLAPVLPGWSLGLELADGQLLDETAHERTVFYAWIAAVLVGVTFALTCLVAGLLQRQMRVARLRNDLVATVSHELKTPLASIRLLVDTLLDRDASAHNATTEENGQAARDASREYLEMIASENARLSRLIDNFLTFSRLERGKHRFQFQTIDANDIIRQAAAVVQDRFDGEHARLTVQKDGPLPLSGDADALVTAVVNLLDNAWKYSGEHKRITMSASRANDRVMIAVQDNGIGLSARAERRVFDRFYQVDQRLSRSHGGCGLGLSIVRFVVEAHGGKITVASCVDKGSTFTLSLPWDAAASPESTRQEVEGRCS